MTRLTCPACGGPVYAPADSDREAINCAHCDQPLMTKVGIDGAVSVAELDVAAVEAEHAAEVAALTQLPGPGVAPRPGWQDRVFAEVADEARRRWTIGEFAAALGAPVDTIECEGAGPLLLHYWRDPLGDRDGWWWGISIREQLFAIGWMSGGEAERDAEIGRAVGLAMRVLGVVESRPS